MAWWSSGSNGASTGFTSLRPWSPATLSSMRSVSSTPSRTPADSPCPDCSAASRLSITGSSSPSRRSLAKRRAVSSSRAMRLRWFSRSARSRRNSSRRRAPSSRAVSSSCSSAATASSCRVPGSAFSAAACSAASFIGSVVMWLPVIEFRAARAASGNAMGAAGAVSTRHLQPIGARGAGIRRGGGPEKAPPALRALTPGPAALYTCAPMLTHLSIQQFAVVSGAELAFGPGMTVVSGETGAGKSLLVDALSLLSGQRADSSVVRHGAARAELHGEFDLHDAPAAAEWLSAQELDNPDAPGTCLLRRVIHADGGSRAWINGRPATLAQLSSLAALLVEIHGQHDQQALLSRPSQLALVDAFGRTGPELAEVGQAARRWSALLDERQALLERGDVSERIEWLQHQYDELEAEDLAADSIARLLADHTRQAHAGDLAAACQAALAELTDRDGAALSDGIHQVRSMLHKVSDHEPRLGEVASMLDAAAIQLD